jgi:DNA (cytosine-5)-methyltransferase 1
MTSALASWERSATGLYVPPRTRPQYERPVAIDLFCGAGGFSCGFHQAGWHVAAAVEYDVDASMTYLLNLARPGVKIHVDPDHPRLGANAPRTKAQRRNDGTSATPFDVSIGSGWISGQPADDPGCKHFYIYDVHTLTGDMILDDLGLERGEVGAVIGGPPCQGFSRAGQQSVMDPRNSLVFEFARLVCEIQPKTFVMENVVGIKDMVTPEGIPVIDALAAAVASGDYGDYEALKRALNSMPGARAGVRGAQSIKEKRGSRSTAADGAQPDQDALFEVE